MNYLLYNRYINKKSEALDLDFFIWYKPVELE